MHDRRQQNIRDYLQQNEAQMRIRDTIQQATSKMAVTISRAAGLFNFSESQLREWEKRGLLQTERPLLSPEGKSVTGHRQYSLQMVAKLAVIRDLINQGYAPGDIPVDIDKLWEEAAATSPIQTSLLAQQEAEDSKPLPMSIDARVETADMQEFWRYFITQSLRLSLLLICEDMPDTVAGIVLPLDERNLAGSLTTPAELQGIGRALVGWLGQNGSFYLFLTDAPTFDFPTDFRLQTLKSADDPTLTGDRVLDNTFIILQRGTRRSTSLAPELRETIRRLLAQIYQRVGSWEPALARGARDLLYQAHNLERASHVAGDRIFNSLLERVIDLGGKTADGQDRWRFCALLLPDDSNQPVQQQSLVVRAQTRHSPFQIGLTRISPQATDQVNSITIKAFEGSQIVSLPAVLSGDSMLHPPQHVQVIVSTPEMIASGRAGEGFQPPPPGEMLHSALAVPVIGEHSISIAVFYVEASEPGAFSSDDQRALRVISRMLEELLMTSRDRNQRLVKRATLLRSPAIVDDTFADFAVEADFIAEMDLLLSSIQREDVRKVPGKEQISIIAIDIDNQSSVALKYGNRIARNLSQQVGIRIKKRLGNAGNFTLFHVSADKYYLLLEGMDLEEVRELAKELSRVLSIGEYRILPLSAVPDRSTQPANMLELAGVTVHMGVSTYTFAKLDELLRRYPVQTAVIYVRTLILAGLDQKLEQGKLEGGNRIVSWDRSIWGYTVLPHE